MQMEDERDRDLSEDLPPFEDNLGALSVDAEEPKELQLVLVSVHRSFRTEKSRTSETIDG